MKKLPLLLTLLCFSALTPALAEKAERTEAAARLVAQQWMSHHRQQARTLNAPITAADTTLACDAYPTAWCYRQANQFVVVSKSAEWPAILGYGSAPTTTTTALPTALQTLLNQTQANHTTVQNSPSQAQVSTTQTLATAAQATYPPEGAEWKATAPLLTSHHGFWSPYNDLCPYYTDAEGHTSTARCVAGCVAIAMEQILAHYKRVYTLQETLPGWTTEHYEIDSIAQGTQVDASLICDVYNTGHETQEQQQAVAQLMYYLGVAAHMNWGLSASGTSTTRLFATLPQAFGLGYAKYLDSYLYTPTDFWNILAHEIMAQRPVYLSASCKTLEGHAFVLDGLDADGLFHVNWGYGAYDGYFRLDVLQLRQPADERSEWVDDGYRCNYEAILACPDEATNPAWVEPTERTGQEVAVDSIWALQEPSSQCYTSLRMAVRNTTSQALTTPLALLTYEANDTLAPEERQYDVVALTGCTLAPYQRDTLQLLAQFTQAGELCLAVTPTDEESLIYTQPVTVSPTGSSHITLGEPQATPTDTSGIALTLPLSNPSATERAANIITFNLLDTSTNADVEKSHELFLAAAADTTLTTAFHHLQPGRTYTCRFRLGGNTERSLTFTLPGTDGIKAIEADNEPALPTHLYNLEGKALPPTSHHKGMVIEQRGKQTRKKLLR